MSSVDVIIPCYRYAHFLRQCVESVLGQSEVDVRVLIIDDASPDDTPEVGAKIAEGDSRVTFLRHAQNKGHVPTFNEGIEWASADYFLLLSADDYLLPGALKRAVTVMDAEPKVGFVFGKAVEFMEQAALHQKDTSSNAIIDRLVGDASSSVLSGADFITAVASNGAVNFVPTPTAVVRTSLQKKVGGYRVELPHTGDWEMWLRLAAHADVGIVRDYQAVYRVHNANMSGGYYQGRGLRDIEQRRAALDIFFHSHGQALPRSSDLRRSLMRALALTALRHASWSINEGELGLAEKFSQIAIDMSPEVKESRAWKVVAFKRKIGVRMSRALVAAARSIRRPFGTRASSEWN